MDDLGQFVEHQRSLAEMSEGDMDEYETRMRLRAKRRKLWNSDGGSLDPSRKEREALELETYLQSLPPEESTFDPSMRETKSQDATPDNCDADDFETASLKHTLSSRGPDAHDCDSLRKPNVGRRARSSLSPILVSASADDGTVNADRLSSFEHHPSSGSQASKVSNNGRVNLREKLLKKRKYPESDGPTAADVSNVTSPSNSPVEPPAVTRSSRVLRPRPTLESARRDRKTLKAKRDEEAAARKKEEEEEKRMTPREYAVRVQTKFVAYLEKVSREKLLLRDKAIFYIGGDYHTASQSTRKKMDHLRKKGATIVPTYDPEVITHIVTEGNATVTLKALGLKSLDDIPMYIPTLTWSWVSEGRQNSPEFWYAAFPSRIDASTDKIPEDLKRRRRGKPNSLSQREEVLGEGSSRIEEFTVADLAVTNKAASAATTNHQDIGSTEVQATDQDPLAEFYAQARTEARAENELLRFTDSNSDEGNPGPTADNSRPRSKFTCDNVPVKAGDCINQDIVDKLSELEEINKTKLSGDPNEQRWRVFSYGKSIRAVKAHPKRIRNYEDATSIRGIGHKTAQKIVEILQTGDLERIKYDKTEDVKAIKLFCDIYGVGLGTAQKWYSMGCRTLEDVKNRKGGITVSEIQEIGLKYYDDINTRIPRKEVEETFNAIKTIALSIDPKLDFHLMGSYRRGKETCGDIDILATRPTDDGRTHQGVLRRLLKELHLQGILIEDLAVPEDFNSLEQTYRGLCRLYDKGPMRRIDILAVPYNERGGALIYYTGDDIFNRAIRLKAKVMGYSLSQHGLSTRVERDKRGNKMVPGDLIASETEEEIFRILGVPWQEPHERVRA